MCCGPACKGSGLLTEVHSVDKTEYNRILARIRYTKEPEKIRAYNRKYYHSHKAEIAARRKAKREARKNVHPDE